MTANQIECYVVLTISCENSLHSFLKYITMPEKRICKHPGCNSSALKNWDYCTLHMHEDTDTFGEKVTMGTAGAVSYVLYDTDTFNCGMDMTEKWMDKAKTPVGKVASFAVGSIISGADAATIRDIKIVGKVGQFFASIFD